MMFHFECDWCKQRFFSSDMWYCDRCAILLCKKCMEREEAGVMLDDEENEYQHCQSFMNELKKNECQLLEVLLQNNPELKDRMLLIFKRNMWVANEILKVAKREGWSHEQLPPQVTNVYSHNLKWLRYEVKKSWGNHPDFHQ